MLRVKIYRFTGVKQDDSYIEKHYRHGRLHRDGGPALVHKSGDTFWYKNGKLHREDGPAVIHVNRSKMWYRNGKLNREDGPAIEIHSGHREWYKNGKLHREDGPAIEYTDNDPIRYTRVWWYKGQEGLENFPPELKKKLTRKFLLEM